MLTRRIVFALSVTIILLLSLSVYLMVLPGQWKRRTTRRVNLWLKSVDEGKVVVVSTDRLPGVRGAQILRAGKTLCRPTASLLGAERRTIVVDTRGCPLTNGSTYRLTLVFQDGRRYDIDFTYNITLRQASKSQTGMPIQKHRIRKIHLLFIVTPRTRTTALWQALDTAANHGLNFTASIYSSLCQRERELCLKLSQLSSGIIPSSYTYEVLPALPEGLREAEIDLGLSTAIEGLKITRRYFLAPYGFVDEDTLRFLAGKGVDAVILPSESSYTCKSGNISLIFAVKLTNSTLGTANSTTVYLTFETPEDLKTLALLAESADKGEVKVLPLGEPVEAGKCSAERLASLTPRSPVYPALWRAYWNNLLEVCDILATVHNSTLTIEALNTINNTPFWLKGYTRREVEHGLSELLGLIARIYEKAGFEACYYLTDVNINKLRGRSFRVLVLEPGEGLSKNDVRYLKESNGAVLAYINLGYAEKWRGYWSGISRTGIVHGPTEYEDEYYVEFWRREWMETILEQASMAADMGFDGVYFDNIDAYIWIREKGFGWAEGINLEDAMAKTVIKLSKALKDRYGRDFKVFINIGSAVELLGRDDLLDLIDGVLREELWFTAKNGRSVEVPEEETSSALHYLRRARTMGKIVVVADFIDSSELAHIFCQRAWENAFLPIPQPVWAINYSQPPPEDWCP